MLWRRGCALLWDGIRWKVSGCGGGSVGTVRRPGWWVASSTPSKRI